MNLARFRHVIAVDFEYSQPAGERPQPVCMVAKNLATGETWRLFGTALSERLAAPFSVNGDSLVIAYFASAEISCFLALGWRLPDNVLDLYTEFRCWTNGLRLTTGGSSLLGALAWHGIATMDAMEKSEMRELAMRGGPYSDREKKSLIEYCESDVLALERLYEAMRANIDVPRGLLRGRYMKAVARIEANGVPIDSACLDSLTSDWSNIQRQVTQRVASEFPVFDDLSFSASRFATYLRKAGLAWPRLQSGALELSDNAFRDMVAVYPHMAPIRDARLIRAQLRQVKLTVGSDNRNRCLLSPFRSKTGRNQPSNSKFIFGPSVWLRSLIKPEPGMGIAYIDWSQQEFGIAAALSGDGQMLEAYRSGDPYIAFGKQSGAIPRYATKNSHLAERNQFKACVLAVQYGMGPDSLAIRIGQPSHRARELLSLHRQTYSTFWQWSDSALDYAMLYSRLHTTFGWQIHVTHEANPRSIRNFPMQANGAEMLRLACCFATERGVRVCAPVHDAILIEAPTEDLDEAIHTTQESMNEASRAVLDGFTLSTDVERFIYPERYRDARGQPTWNLVNSLITPNAGDTSGTQCA